MPGGDDVLLGTVVQKRITGNDAARPNQIAGRVVGIAPAAAQNGVEKVYRVVYEDGDEAYLTQSEVCTWLMDRGRVSDLATKPSAIHPTVSTTMPGVSRLPAIVHKPPSTTTGTRCAGKVVGQVMCSHSAEPGYLVVYEDGDEAVLPESEVRFRAAACSRSSVTTRSTDARSVSMASTIPLGTSTTTAPRGAPLAAERCHSYPQFYEPSRYSGRLSNIVPIRYDECQGGRMFSQGPIPNYLSAYELSGPVKGFSFGGCVAGLLVLVFALIVALFFNRMAELLCCVPGFGGLLWCIKGTTCLDWDWETSFLRSRLDGTPLTQNPSPLAS